MRALLLGSRRASFDPARPIAGAPLLARQLEHLRANGATHAFVNVATGASREALREEALNVGIAITWLPSHEPLAREELARRAGVHDEPVVVLAAGRLSDVDLRAAFELARTSGDDVAIGEPPRAIEIWHAGRAHREPRVVPASGWIADVLDEASAQALTEDVLLGRAGGVEVRGSAIAPGVWTSRDATIAVGARVNAPCFLGPGSFVAEGAEIGPGAVIGARVVVERAARVRHARIADDVVVGQGLDVEDAHVEEGAIVPHAGEPIALDDALLVASRRSRGLPARVAAAAAFGVIAPFAIARGGAARDVARRLARIVEGRGAWLGVRGDDPEAAVIDVEPLLVPPGARAEERVAARALYRATKSTALDGRLLLTRLLGGDAR